MDIRDLNVRRGDLVLPALKKLIAYCRELRILPGRGILLTRTLRGVVVNARRAVVGFTGSWNVAMSNDQIKVGRGFVDGLQPVIDGKPISGIDDKGNDIKDGQPSLKLDANLYEQGKSWIAIRGECNPETGKILTPKDQPPKLTVIQTKILTSEEDTIFLHPIAMLRRPAEAKAGFGNLYQIAFFDYSHWVSKQNGKWRHFLVPA